MKDVKLIFSPYRSFAIAAYFGIVIEVGCLLILGGLLFNSQQFSIEVSLIVLFCAILAGYLIKIGFGRKKITIYFTEDGLHLIK